MKLDSISWSNGFDLVYKATPDLLFIFLQIISFFKGKNLETTQVQSTCLSFATVWTFHMKPNEVTWSICFDLV